MIFFIRETHHIPSYTWWVSWKARYCVCREEMRNEWFHYVKCALEKWKLWIKIRHEKKCQVHFSIVLITSIHKIPLIHSNHVNNKIFYDVYLFLFKNLFLMFQKNLLFNMRREAQNIFYFTTSPFTMCRRFFVAEFNFLFARDEASQEIFLAITDTSKSPLFYHLQALKILLATSALRAAKQVIKSSESYSITSWVYRWLSCLH